MGLYRRRCACVLFAIIACFSTTQQNLAYAEKSSLVLMPLRTTGMEKGFNAPMETALVEGLALQYKVYAGERVAAKVREIFERVSKETPAGQLCDDTKCLQNVAIEFQAELVSNATIMKSSGGFFLTLNIVNVLEDVVVYSKSETCEGCSEFQVIAKLKEIAGVGNGNGATPMVPSGAPAQIYAGLLKVSTHPPQTKVAIYNSSRNLVAEKEAPFSLNLISGKYKLALSKEGYTGIELTVDVKGGSEIEIDGQTARLRKQEGIVKVTSEPFFGDIELLVDGKPSGKLPSELLLPSGVHTFRMETEYLNGSSSVSVEDESVSELTIPLKRRFLLDGITGGVRGGIMRIRPSGYWSSLADLFFPVYGAEIDLFNSFGSENSPVHYRAGFSSGTLKAKTSAGEKFSLDLAAFRIGLVYDGGRRTGPYAGAMYLFSSLDYRVENAYGQSKSDSSTASTYSGEVGYVIGTDGKMRFDIRYSQTGAANVKLLSRSGELSTSSIDGVVTYEW